MKNKLLKVMAGPYTMLEKMYYTREELINMYPDELNDDSFSVPCVALNDGTCIFVNVDVRSAEIREELEVIRNVSNGIIEAPFQPLTEYVVDGMYTARINFDNKGLVIVFDDICNPEVIRLYKVLVNKDNVEYVKEDTIKVNVKNRFTLGEQTSLKYVKLFIQYVYEDGKFDGYEDYTKESFRTLENKAEIE